jgi:hypothetical protein
MANYGIKVSKPGYDVTSAADRYLSLSSKLNMFKVFSSGTSSVTSGNTLQITHSLGYIPNFMVYIETDGSTNQMEIVSASLITNKAQAYADSTKLYVYNYGSSTRDVYYYIMYDPI